MKVRKLKLAILARMDFNRRLAAYEACWQAGFSRMMAKTPEEKARDDAWFEEFWDDLSKNKGVQLVGTTVVIDNLSATLNMAVDFLNKTPEEAKALFGPDSVEAAKQEFVVVKKSNGEVVGAFDVLDDAMALIEKHRRQKKAVLVLLDTAA